MNPALAAALIAAFAGLVVAIVGLIPNMGRLQRLERVVSILERIPAEDESARQPLLRLRDRLIVKATVGISVSTRLVLSAVVIYVAGLVITLTAKFISTGSAAILIGLLGALLTVVALALVIIATFIDFRTGHAAKSASKRSDDVVDGGDIPPATAPSGRNGPGM